MSNSSDSTNQADDWLKIKRELQLLKAEDGEYVLRSLGSVYALPALIDYIAQAQQQLVRELVEQLPHKFEQDITRTQDGDLMCDTCGSDVFGGICACETVNGIIDQVTALLNKKLQAYGGEK